MNRKKYIDDESNKVPINGYAWWENVYGVLDGAKENVKRLTRRIDVK